MNPFPIDYSFLTGAQAFGIFLKFQRGPPDWVHPAAGGFSWTWVPCSTQHILLYLPFFFFLELFFGPFFLGLRVLLTPSRGTENTQKSHQVIAL